MQYLTIVLRYEDNEKLPVPELDDKVLGGEITNISVYDVSRVAEIAVNALDDDFDEEVIEQITGVISGHL